MSNRRGAKQQRRQMGDVPKSRCAWEPNSALRTGIENHWSI